MQKVYKDPKIGLPTTDFDQPASYDPKLFSCDGDAQLDVPTVPELGL
jgi:hypothetical protein